MEETKDETKAEPAPKTTTPKVAAQPDHHHKWNPFVAKRVAMKLASPAHAAPAAPAPAAAPAAAFVKRTAAGGIEVIRHLGAERASRHGQRLRANGSPNWIRKDGTLIRSR